jgi:transcriptional regulator with XRE-family HTH domain
MAKTKLSGKTYFREWRQHRALTLQVLADRMSITPSHLSMLERGQRGYSQAILESLAAALRVDKASLLLGDPSDPSAIWSVWDRAKASQKRRIEEQARTILKKGN